jgi:hypothetical protein
MRWILDGWVPVEKIRWFPIDYIVLVHCTEFPAFLSRRYARLEHKVLSFRGTVRSSGQSPEPLPTRDNA